MNSISNLIESFALTTAHRDRDQIDLSVARLLHDYVEASQVAVYRLIDDGRARRVQRRILIDRNGHEYGTQSQPVNELPRLPDTAHWYECDMTRDPVHYGAGAGPGASIGTVFPLPGEWAAAGSVYTHLSF